MRGGAPKFKVEDVVFNGCRLKRVRYWVDLQTSSRILPWIALNPSGAVLSGSGLSGLTMARLAYLWGFDGVATYNLVPLAGSKPKRDVLPKITESNPIVEQQIRESHAWIAEELADSDAAIAAWGKDGRALGKQITQLLSAINSYKYRILPPMMLWCAGTNIDGTPKHAGARGRHRIPADFRPIKFDHFWIGVRRAAHCSSSP